MINEVFLFYKWMLAGWGGPAGDSAVLTDCVRERITQHFSAFCHPHKYYYFVLRVVWKSIRCFHIKTSEWWHSYIELPHYKAQSCGELLDFTPGSFATSSDATCGFWRAETVSPRRRRASLVENLWGGSAAACLSSAPAVTSFHLRVSLIRRRTVRALQRRFGKEEGGERCRRRRPRQGCWRQSELWIRRQRASPLWWGAKEMNKVCETRYKKMQCF